jgi:hypothetical protein
VRIQQAGAMAPAAFHREQAAPYRTGRQRPHKTALGCELQLECTARAECRGVVYIHGVHLAQRALVARSGGWARSPPPARWQQWKRISR